MISRIPVLIVGAGPVGLALAGELGWRGTACLLIEKGNGTTAAPKMDMVGVRSMEICRRWGIADWVEHSAYPRDYSQDNVYVTSLTGYELAREVIPPKNDEPLSPFSPHNRQRCPQDMFDPILRRFVETLPAASMQFGMELIGFEERADGVCASVRHTGSGEIEEIWADYLVGTDGGGSLIRRTVGIGMTGQPVLTYATNIIFRCTDLPSLHDKGKAYRFVFIGPEGTWLTIVAIDGADRWRMSVVGTQEKQTFSEDEVHALILRAMGKDFDYEIQAIVPWVRRELVADRFGSDHVFIAGDAAHLMSPTGGFGMNTGIGDAVDLGWKLDAVLQGWAGPDLLASYEAERRPVAQRNVAESSGNLRRMLSSRDRKPPAEMFEPGPDGDVARKTFGDWYAAEMRREWFTLGIHLGYRYEASPIIVPDGTPPPPDEVATYVPTTRPGSRAPHVWLQDGRSTLDLFGQGFVLLRLGQEPPPVDRLVAAAAGCRMPLEVIDIEEPEVVVAYERRLVLVRPDGHVGWRSDAEPAQPDEIVDRVRGVVPKAARSRFSTATAV